MSSGEAPSSRLPDMIQKASPIYQKVQGRVVGLNLTQPRSSRKPDIKAVAPSASVLLCFCASVLPPSASLGFGPLPPGVATHLRPAGRGRCRNLPGSMLDSRGGRGADAWRLRRKAGGDLGSGAQLRFQVRLPKKVSPEMGNLYNPDMDFGVERCCATLRCASCST